VPRQQRVAALGSVHLPPGADVQELTCQGASGLGKNTGQTMGRTWAKTYHYFFFLGGRKCEEVSWMRKYGDIK